MRTVTEAEHRHWHENGWLMIADALSGNVRAALPGWVADISRPASPDDGRLHYFEMLESGKALCRTERFLEDHTQLRAMITEGPLPVIAANLMGEDVRLFKEKVNHKAPGGGGFAPHQDATAYPDAARHVTCLVAADAMTPENGCLEFAAGLHGMLLPQNGDGCLDPQVAAGLDWRPVSVPAGGVLFFTTLVPHRSGPNRSNAPRRAIYLTYNAHSEGDRRTAYYDLRDKIIAGAEPSSTARISTIGHFQGRTA